MRIGLIAPPWLPVPPPGYGGTEAVIDPLATGLQARGHDVLLFTTGDSTCPVPRAWVREGSAMERLGQSVVEVHHLLHAYERLRDVDVVHDHTALGPVLARGRFPGPLVATHHGPFSRDLGEIFQRVARYAAVVAISHDHASRAPFPVTAVVHHGVRPADFTVGAGDGDYLLFLGRFSPDKGAREAAEIAHAAGVPLIMAAKKREQAEIDYFDKEIAPLLGQQIRYVGEVGMREKQDLLGSARALLNPIRWPEPFGLVMIESLACGTPVLTLRSGAAPEIVTDAVTGFVCGTDDDLQTAIGRIDQLDRAACRRAVETHFCAERMVDEYERIYEDAVARRS